MDSGGRVALVNRMVGLVNQLYLLETCCPQMSCYPKTTPNNYDPKTYTPILSCAPCDPKALNVSQPRPKHISHNCGIALPKTPPSNIYKPNAMCAYTRQEPKPNTCGIGKPKTNLTTTYKTDYIYPYRPTTTSPSAFTPQDPKPCFMVKCKPHKCQTNPNDEPLITWTPVLEIRKTTNAKNLERENDNPLTKYVFAEPPGCPYKPVWSTKDPMCETHCGPPPGCPALGPPPGYDGEPVELCCPGGRGPPVDRWGQPYECKQTLDGRAICKPTKEAGPTDWCDAKTTPFKQCDTMEDSKRILTRGKVLNQRFKTNVCIDRDNSKHTTSLYKRPVWPRKETCNGGRCRCPDNPGNKGTLVPKPLAQSRGLNLCCTEI